MSWNEKFVGPAPKPKPQEPYGPYLPQQKQSPEPLVLIAQAGDDFYKLARDYFLQPQQLRGANLHLCDPQDLRGGEALIIPLDQADMMQMNSFLLKHTFNQAEPRRRFGRLMPKSKVDARLFTRCERGDAGGALTEEQLAQVVSARAAKAALWQVNRAMREADVNTAARQVAFLSQIAHESAGLTTLTEGSKNDSYFDRYEPGTSPGRAVGNTQKGDGRRFKGRGLIQLTGRENYTNAWIDLNLQVRKDDSTKNLHRGVDPVNPDLAADPETSARLTAWYWTSRNLNSVADGLPTAKDEAAQFLALSIGVNGKNRKTGLPNGLEDRKLYYRRAKKALGVTWGTIR